MNHKLNLQQIYLLTFLAEKDNYGLALMQIAKDRCQTIIFIGSIYVFLCNLEAAGLLEAYPVKNKSGKRGRARKYYKITEAGKKELKRYQTIFSNLWQLKPAP